MNELLEKWKERLRQFKERPEIAKGMDDRTAMGVQHGRTMTLAQCIQELEALTPNTSPSQPHTTLSEPPCNAQS